MELADNDNPELEISTQVFQKNDLEMIETLFLIGQYQTAFDLSVKELDIFLTIENYFLDPQFVSLVIVSLQSLSHIDGEIDSFLKKYFGTLDRVSYEVLFLSVNIYISKQKYTEAEELILVALDFFEKQQSRLSQTQYNKFVDILVLYVYIPANKLDAALKLIKAKSSFIQNPSVYHQAIESQIERNAEKVKSQEQSRKSPVKTPNSSPKDTNSSNKQIPLTNSRDGKSSSSSLMNYLFKLYQSIKNSGLTNVGIAITIFLFIIYKRNYFINFLSNFFPSKTIEPKNLRSQKPSSRISYEVLLMDFSFPSSLIELLYKLM